MPYNKTLPLIFLQSFPLNRSQSVGWLQQELAVCFVNTQARLDHSGQDSRLVAHFAEFFVSSKIPTPIDSASLNKAGETLASLCLFIAYLYRFGVSGLQIFFKNSRFPASNI